MGAAAQDARGDVPRDDVLPLDEPVAPGGARVEPGRRVGARPVRAGVPARRRRGESRRPPTRTRVVAGRRMPPVADCAPRRVPRRWPWLVALAIATGIGVAGLGLLAEGVGGAAPVPTETTLVAVAPGETLWDVAARFAPDSELGAVIRRIQELNGLTGAPVPAGTPLAVPYQPGLADGGLGEFGR
ncbi:LysM peptidoglycan-binding domain-containing protein [Amycolatopsis aidingensis]|uniref:LysM peptidoglycan-binding domain-containing protein n=1 Tax=Amycolatopsis aidingensis TaxID=2842453 RepID=UPI001E29E4EF|nr:LysM peptidoglycan-binding domain-containing protein [Amycolatopsis aidingensis]